MTQPEILKPLKTWSHLAGQRRKPSEYEIVTTNLHYTTNNPDAPFELDPNFPIAQWFKKNRNACPLKHADWDAFRDPDELIYRTYNMLQDGQETYVHGLLDQMSERGHDSMLERTWAGRSDSERSNAWVERQLGKISSSLAAMSKGLADKPWCCNGNHLTLADIAVGCALGYLDFRFAHIDWRSEHANLAQLYERLAQRQSFKDTAPA